LAKKVKATNKRNANPKYQDWHLLNLILNDLNALYG